MTLVDGICIQQQTDIETRIYQHPFKSLVMVPTVKLHLDSTSAFGNGLANHLVLLFYLVPANTSLVTVGQLALEVLHVVPWPNHTAWPRLGRFGPLPPTSGRAHRSKKDGGLLVRVAICSHRA